MIATTGADTDSTLDLSAAQDLGCMAVCAVAATCAFSPTLCLIISCHVAGMKTYVNGTAETGKQLPRDESRLPRTTQDTNLVGLNHMVLQMHRLTDRQP